MADPPTDHDETASRDETASDEAASIDQDLQRLRPKKRRRSPLVGVAVILLGAWLIGQTREEVAYYFSPAQPIDLGDAPKAVASGRLRHNTHVRVRGTPDRKHAIVIEGNFGSFKGVFPLVRTRASLFVAQPRKNRQPPDKLTESFAGRLVRFDSQSFFPQIFGYYSEKMTLTYEFDPREIAKSAGHAPARLRDRSGGEIELPADRGLFISVAFPDEYRVQFDKLRHPRQEDAERTLAELGFPWAPIEESRPFWAYLVRAEGEAAMKLIERFGDLTQKIGVVPRSGTYVARLGEIQAKDNSLLLRPAGAAFPDVYAVIDGKLVAHKPETADQPVLVPLARIRSIDASTPYRIPMDGFVLLENDHPKSYGWFFALDLVLGAIILGNAVVLGLRWKNRGARKPA
ncbi:MAG: hypothetical protein AABZ30_15065 [Myxococcota bacterium]